MLKSEHKVRRQLASYMPFRFDTSKLTRKSVSDKLLLSPTVPMSALLEIWQNYSYIAPWIKALQCENLAIEVNKSSSLT